MVRADTAKLLEELAGRDTPAAAWSIVERIVHGADPGVVPEVRRRAEAGELERCPRPFVALLSRFRGPDVEAALRTFLGSRDLDAVAATLGALAPYLSPVDGPMVARSIRSEDHSIRLSAIIAAAHARDRSLAPLVAASLDASSDDERMQAAITLGHLGAPDSAPALASRLTKERDRVFAALTAALEMVAEPSVTPAVVSAMRTAEDRKVWDLAHTLRVLSGCDLALPPGASLEHVRKAWLDAAGRGLLVNVPPARVAGVRPDENGCVSFDVDFGTGDLQIDFDPPTPGATWPRWARSLRVRGQRVLDVGSTCGTCESLLKFVSWPGEDVSGLAAELEDRRGELDLAAWVSAWSPLLCHLRAGRHLAAELSLAVERIEPAAMQKSWFNRRLGLRIDEDEASSPVDEPTLSWPGMTHYQGALVGEPPIYPVVLPLRDPGALDGGTIAHFCAAIAAGERPPVVAWAWHDSREVQGRWPERFLYLAILNGHHRLEAYARAEVPARFVAVGCVDASWGPPEDRAAWLREAFVRFRGMP